MKLEFDRPFNRSAHCWPLISGSLPVESVLASLKQAAEESTEDKKSLQSDNLTVHSAVPRPAATTAVTAAELVNPSGSLWESFCSFIVFDLSACVCMCVSDSVRDEMRTGGIRSAHLLFN